MTEYNTLLLEVNSRIGLLTINRPKALNALNSELLTELNQVVEEIRTNDEIGVVIITGAGGKAFVAGADIKEMAAKNPIEGQEFSELGNTVFKSISNLKQPVIAAVNGFALGGGLELALAADIRIGTKNATVGQPEVGLGIIPGFGATQRLSRTVGLAKAKELILTARNIEADEALQIGLFNTVIEQDELMKTAKEMARQILENAPLAVQYSKAVIDEGYDMPLEQAITLEENTFGLLFSTEDQKEGMSAFLEKRDAEFKNK